MATEPRLPNYGQRFDTVIVPTFNLLKERFEHDSEGSTVKIDRIGFMDRIFIECDADNNRSWGISIQFTHVDPEDDSAECFYFGTVGNVMAVQENAIVALRDITQRYIDNLVRRIQDSIVRKQQEVTRG